MSQFVDKHAISRKKINHRLNYFVEKKDAMQNVFVKSFIMKWAVSAVRDLLRKDWHNELNLSEGR